jgi:hypothetical protein
MLLHWIYGDLVLLIHKILFNISLLSSLHLVI